MLTETMTHAEVYRELERDRDTETTWWRHHLDYEFNKFDEL